MRRLILCEVRLKAKIRYLEHHYMSLLEMVIDGFLPNNLQQEMVQIVQHTRTLKGCLTTLQRRIKREFEGMGVVIPPDYFETRP